MKDSKKVTNFAILTCVFFFVISAIISGLGIYGLVKLKEASGSTQLANTANGLIAAIIIVFTVGFIFFILICVKISQYISRPIGKLAGAAEKLAEGKLNVQVNVKSSGEIGSLSVSLNKAFLNLQTDVDEISGTLVKMSDGDFASEIIRDYPGDFAPISEAFKKILDKLNRTFNIIRNSAGQVDEGARQVSIAAQQLAQGAAEQAASAEELSASITDISQKVGENSEHITKATVYIDETAKDIKESNNQMGKMLAAMEEISSASNEIKNIIKVIDNIAFQTNILALNAAVEAARAGEAGKGFAVVADEVRSLAGKSAGAAKQTTELIGTAIKKVQDGVKIADITAKSLMEASARTAKADNTIKKIADTSNAQSAAISQITQGIEQISSVIQTNSATAQESAAASEELSGQADLLKEELTKFKIKQAV